MEAWMEALQGPYGLMLLLVVSFLAATLLPLSSEVVLAALVAGGSHSPWGLWLMATLGNVAGSAVNAWMGRGLLHFQHRPWFPVSPPALERASTLFCHYGWWSLLFAWLPVVGDALTLAAGVMRMPWGWFTLLVTLGKGGRYGVVIYLALMAVG